MKGGKSSVIRKPRLSNQIYELIRSDLRSGNYAADARLTEPDIAEELQTSRTPVREALFQLVNNGLLCEYPRGYGLPKLSKQDILQMMELRMALENLLIGKLCQNITEASVKQLRSAVASERKAINKNDSAQFISANNVFRDMLYNFSGNRYLKESTELYSDRMQIFRVLSLSSKDKDNRKFVTDSHERLVNAIAEKNENLAISIHTKMLESATKAYVSLAEVSR